MTTHPQSLADATAPQLALRPRPLRVLLAHRYFWPENISLYPAMLKEIAEWHVARGHATTILAPRATADQFRRREWAAAHGIELCEPVIPVDRGHGGLTRVVFMTRYLFSLAALLFRRRWDLVIVSTYPPVGPATVARLLARLRGFKYVYYTQDLYPEMLEAGGSRITQALGRALKSVDRRNARAAVATITLSEQMKRTLVRRGVPPERVFVLPNFGVDAPIVNRPRAGGSPPTLVFAGNHGAIQNLPFFLRAAHAAAARRTFRVLMIGGGGELDSLKRIVADEGMDHVEFAGQLARDDAQRRIAASDVGVVAAAPRLFDVAYPSKTTSYLLAGLPVLVFVDPDSPMAASIAADNLGVAASPTHPDHAADAIVRIVDRVRRGDFVRAAISRHAAVHLSLEAYLTTYARVCSLQPPERMAA